MTTLILLYLEVKNYIKLVVTEYECDRNITGFLSKSFLCYTLIVQSIYPANDVQIISKTETQANHRHSHRQQALSC